MMNRNKRNIWATIGVAAIMVGLLVPQAVFAQAPDGIDPNNPIQVVVANGQTTAQTGQLPPLGEVWFELTTFDMDDRYINQEGAEEDEIARAALDLSLFVNPVNGNDIQNIRMDLFPVGYAAHWSHGHVYAPGLPDDLEDDLVHAAPFGSGTVAVIEGDDEQDTILFFEGEGDEVLGKLEWSGRSFENEPILVRVRNETGAPKNFALFTADVSEVELGQVAQAETAETEDAAVARAMAMVELMAGDDPNHPLSVAAADGPALVQTGRLPALEEVWLKVTPSSFAEAQDTDSDNVSEDSQEGAPPVDLTLFVTPVDGNTVDRIRMDLFPANFAEHWSHGHIYQLGLTDDERDEVEHAAPFGAGTVAVVSDTDEDDTVYTFQAEGNVPVGKLVWSGRAVDSEPFLVRIANETGSAKDFALFSGDIDDVDLSEVAQAQPAVAAETAQLMEAEVEAMAESMVMAALERGSDPNHPIEVLLVNGQIVAQNGQVPASDEVWFAVTTSDIDDRYINQGGSEEDEVARPPLDMTFLFTPVDGNTVDQISMELFPASYATHWSHGHLYRFGLPDDLEDELLHAAPFGMGTVAVVSGEDEDTTIYSFQSEDGAPVGKMNWSGRAFANETILVRVANDTDAPLDFVLYTADVENFGN